MARKKLSDEQRQINHRNSITQYRLKNHTALEFGLPDLNVFESKFTSETAASDSRGDVLVGTFIGNGARWIRYPRHK